MIRRLTKRFGLNYAWGLINFTAGVALASAVTGFAAGVGGLCR